MSINILKKINARVNTYVQYLYAWTDYKKYASSLSSFRKIVKSLPPQNKGSLLIVSGRSMNVVWAQIWSILSLAVRMHGYRGLVLTNHSDKHINRYYKLLNLELIYYDDIAKDFPISLPVELAKKVDKANSLHDYRNISYEGTPFGDIALSTYTRYYGTGIIDLNNQAVVKFIKEWISHLYQSIQIAEYIYKKHNVEHLFFTEFFLEEYGAFYYTALKNELNIIKFTGTVRDNAILLHHITKTNDGLHHAAILPSTWGSIKKMPLTSKIEADLAQNFLDRYGEKWRRSYRNHRNTKIMPVEEAKKLLGISQGRKVAVIYSHILYDSLFVFGTDLFDNYAEWFVETVRVAVQNPEVDWFIKVHPSNIWRGELNTLLKGKYEEERLISQKIGELPTHVHIVPADNKINPYTWFQLADYGITVRGTSGLEMAALGKTVITAGTGRYESNGFTIDPKNKTEYLTLLKKLHEIPPPSSEQVELAKRYAYALFVLKPFTITSLTPRLRAGVKQVVASDDIIYIPKTFNGDQLPQDIQKLSQWVFDRDNLELLSEWGF